MPDNAMIADHAEILSLPGTITPTSWVPPDDLDMDRWEYAIGWAHNLRGAALWWIGDGLNWGEARYGEKYAQVMDATRYEYSTLANAASVARKVAPATRRADLTWSHHAEVAVFEDASEQSAWLARAVVEKMTSKALREAIQVARGVGVGAQTEGGSDASPKPDLKKLVDRASRQAFIEWTEEDGPKGVLMKFPTSKAYREAVRRRLAARTAEIVLAEWRPAR